MTSNSSAPICTDELCFPSSAPATSSSKVSSVIGSDSNSSNSKRVLKIDIVSDVVCPWCLVGKRRLEKALRHVDSSKVSVQIRWLPFQLNPSAPLVSVSKMEFYHKKFGPRTAALMANMKSVGLEEGIQFSYTDKGRTGNTLKSHQLIEAAAEFGGEKMQNAIVERLFKDYFEKEEDLTRDEILIAAATSVGINESAAREALNSAELRKKVEANVKTAYEKNVSGVPHFTIDDKYEVGGAQDPAVFLNIFKKIGVPTSTGSGSAL